MPQAKYIVGCVVRDQDWALPLWFESVKANMPLEETGVVMVVPPEESMARDYIKDGKEGFAWVSVERDKREGPLVDPHECHYKQEGDAWNQILAHLSGVRPDAFLAWAPNIVFPPGTIEGIERTGVAASTVWTWLNRSEPRTVRHDGALCEYQEPVQATGMRWHDLSVDVGQEGAMPVHYDSHEFGDRATGAWKADVIVGFVYLGRLAYPNVRFEPHRDGHWVPVSRQLEERGIERWVYADKLGVCFPEYRPDELLNEYPAVCNLAAQMPLQAQKPYNPDDELGFLGLYPHDKTAKR